MIQFNELYISTNGNCLKIDASIVGSPLYEEVYLSKIYIDTQDTFSQNGPSASSIVIPIKEDSKRFSTALTKADLNGLDIKSNLFFVYVEAKGYPDPSTPCGEDNSIIIGTVSYMRPLYCRIMSFLKEFSSNCTIPKGFIDYALLLEAFDISVKCGSYLDTVYLWKKLNRNNVIDINTNCGCYG